MASDEMLGQQLLDDLNNGTVCLSSARDGQSLWVQFYLQRQCRGRYKGDPMGVGWHVLQVAGLVAAEVGSFDSTAQDHAAGARVRDASATLAAQMLEPIKKLPSTPELLAAALRAKPLCRFPVEQCVLDLLSATGHAELQDAFTLRDQSCGSIAAGLSSVMWTSLSQGPEQSMMFDAPLFLVRLLVQTLDDLLTGDKKLGLLFNLFEEDQDSTTTIKLSEGGPSLRLDWQLRKMIGLQLLFTWKVCSTGVPMRAAVEDLRAKMGPWSPMYYGDVPYLMVATAAEGELQFHAILRTTPTDLVPVSEKTDLATPAGRAEAVIAIINLHRLLHGVKACLPSYVLPLGYVDVRHY